MGTSFLTLLLRTSTRTLQLSINTFPRLLSPHHLLQLGPTLSLCTSILLSHHTYPVRKRSRIPRTTWRFYADLSGTKHHSTHPLCNEFLLSFSRYLFVHRLTSPHTSGPGRHRNDTDRLGKAAAPSASKSRTLWSTSQRSAQNH